MKLMTKELEAKIPRLYSQEDVDDPIVYAKYFHPLSNWTWYATEYSPQGEGMFFGWVNGSYPELGYFSLAEFQELEIGGLGMERDLYWEPKKLSEIPGAPGYEKKEATPTSAHD